MRLLIITQDFPPEIGGIQTYSISHAAHLSRWCEWFALLCPDKKKASAVDQILPYKVIRVKSRNSHLGLHLLRRLPPLLRQNRIDSLFHTQWQTAAASIRAREAGLVKKVFAAAHIRELLFNPYESFPLLEKKFIQYREWVLRNVDHFYPVSDYTACRLQEMGVEKERMTVVINGTNPGHFYPDPSGGSRVRRDLGLEDKKILLTITRLNRRKGIDTVLSVLPKLQAGLPDIHYVIAGEGDDRKRLRYLVRKYKLGDHVTFTGNVPKDELNDYYNAADLFVMPSHTQPPEVEGFGIVFLEANACGLPVIGSDSGGIPSAIIDGVTGCIVPEDDPDALAERILFLFKTPELMQIFGKQGRERVLAEANWGAASRKLYEDMHVRMEE